MTGRIQQEIRQSKPVPLALEAFFNLLRTTSKLRETVEESMSAEGGLKQTEYNVLRILRGSGPDGATQEEIRQRLLAPDPLLPAVLGGLANRGLIERVEQRRRISTEGLSLVDRVASHVDQVLTKRMACLSDAEIRSLIDLLERLRA